MEQLLLLCGAFSSRTLCRFISALSARPFGTPHKTIGLDFNVLFSRNSFFAVIKNYTPPEAEQAVWGL
jgi:hypothetical protein